jgi:serpin B
LIPTGAINPRTILTLVNAFYLRAPWNKGFKENLTKPQVFLVRGREGVIVPMMANEFGCGYRKEKGYQIVSCYFSGSLQFLILLPDNPAGLPAVEAQLTPELLAGCASLPRESVILRLPRFRIEPPTLPLRESLKMLGMKTAFDEPTGSANFDRLAARKPEEYLRLDAVLHKTVLFVDETGSEAAAAAAGIGALSLGAPPPPKIEVRVGHPFLFAIQDTASGACLFLGRVTDPR